MSVNKCILVGRLGQNPELKYTPSGAAVTNFSIATNESWKDKAGAKQEHVEWHKLVAWNQTAELIAKYLTKGRQAYFEGKLQTRNWQDKDGQTKYTTEIVVHTVQFLDSGGQKNESAAAGPSTAAPSEPGFTVDDIPF